MKKIALLFTLIFVNISILLAQAPPQGINYQAVVYSDNGNNQPGLNVPGQVLRNRNIRVRFTLIQNTANGTEVYKESHTTTTDAFGMFSLVIGEGTPQGSLFFSNINWGAGKHFLKVEIDKNGGTNYVTMSNQQLLSVPYALYSDKSTYATTAGNGIASVSDNGNGSLTFTYTDGSTYTTPILTGLQGQQGIQGATGAQGPAGQNGTNGVNGTNGPSAYDIWLSQGNTGTQQDFLNSLQGSQGTTGLNGTNGPSAYDIWLTQGNTGTAQDFLNSLQVNAVSSGPIFITPISVYTINSEYTSTNSSVTVDFDTIIGHNVSSVILYYEHLCSSGSSTLPVKCKIDVNTNNTNYELCDHYNQMYQNTSYYVYGGSSGQIVLPLAANGIMTFTNNIIRTNFKLNIIGYYN